MKEHVGIIIGIFLSSLLSYYVAVYFREPIAVELIIINILIGCFIYISIIIIKFDENKDVKK